MADNSLPVDENGVMSKEDINALISQTRGQLVSKYPLLNADPRFQSELTDVFSRFVNQGAQKGSDYDALYNQIIAPFAQKWAAVGTQQTGAMDLQANQVARQTGSPTAAMQMFPQLLAPGSAYRANWQSRLAQEDKTAAEKNKPSLEQEDTRRLLNKQADTILANTPANPNDDQRAALDTAEKAVTDYDRQVQASLMPQRVLQPSAIPSPATTAPAVTGAAPGVAAPMGTSGYVDYSQPLSAQRGITYMGPSLTPAQEAARFNPQSAVVQTPSDVPAGADTASASSAPSLLIDPSRLAVDVSQLPGALPGGGAIISSPQPMRNFSGPPSLGIGRVKVQDPTGMVGTIPANQLQDALKSGYVQVQ